ncbi:type 1 fimbrial protein [Enterobacter sp. ASE]|uniref:fimbrial protein n=1 Tax=Enterobacter sp. ASE TaxID=2905968 RepID=UPI001E3CB32A|nr:fimbrial protein [Enterobacter sp. ASE]MCE3115165.1 type 1 fimbrial protein [Enterobacter sp. ASE]
MKLNKLVIALGMGMVMAAGAANAKDQGHGTITFTGAIIDAPCSITAETANQTVDLGQVSNSALNNGQTSTPKAFFIQLEQCDSSKLKSGVQAAFTGATDAQNPEMLGITGSAKGAGIVVTDGSGTPIKLDGTLSNAQTIGDGSNKLSFSAYLQANGASVTPGDFSSTADFTLSYN